MAGIIWECVIQHLRYLVCQLNRASGPEEGPDADGLTSLAISGGGRSLRGRLAGEACLAGRMELFLQAPSALPALQAPSKVVPLVVTRFNVRSSSIFPTGPAFPACQRLID